MKRKILMICLCVLFLAMAVYAGVRLYALEEEYKTGEEAYEALSHFVQPVAPQQSKPQQSTADTDPQPHGIPAETVTEEAVSLFPVVDFEGLLAICPDVKGWLTVEGTNISYPVVQAKNNDYYLRRLIDGSYNKAGSLFIDYENSSDFSDRNTVIYGHNLKSGTMFASLAKFKKQSFYDAHPTGQLMTPHGNYTVEFFAGYVADLNSSAWDLEFESDEDFAKWLEQAQERSTFTAAVTPTVQDRVLTLSTCSYEFDNARYVLLGILKEEQ